MLEPGEWIVNGITLYHPINCPECFPKQEAAKAEAEDLNRRRSRCEKYQLDFPLETAALRALTLDAFEKRKGAEKATAAVGGYIEGLPSPHPAGLLIHGTPGNGKSNLAALIALEARKRLMAVAYIPAYDWLWKVSNLPIESRTAPVEKAAAADLVILDDLGVRRPTAAQAEWLLNIVDSVYRRKALIVCTSNHKPSDLANALTPPQGKDDPEFPAGERIVDRLAEMAVFITNGASSYRLEIAKRRLTSEGAKDAG